MAGSDGGGGQPEVSAVMAVFNGNAYLREAVESILDQSFRDFEFIVVDDGSTDATPRILQEYRRVDSRVKVLTQPNSGVTAALNRGCGAARGRYIARVDADDVSMKDRLSLQVEFLRRHDRVALVGGTVDLIDSKGQRFDVAECPLSDREIRRALAEGNCFAHTSVAFRSAAWRAVGGYRRAFVHAEDYDLWLRIAEQYDLASLPETLAGYRIHGDQLTARHLRQQAVSMVGARVAARLRRDTGTDPFCDVGQVTPELLKGHGVAEQEIERQVQLSGLWWVRLLLRSGRDRAAVKLYREVTGVARDGKSDRAVLGALYWDQARQFRWEGRLAAGIVASARAVRKWPTIAMRVGQSLVRDIAGVGSHFGRRLW